MKHIKLTFLFAVLLSIVGTKVFAYDAYIGNGIYYNFSGDEAEVTSGDYKYSGNVVIPASVTYNGKTYCVTSIGWSAFEGCSSLTSVTIPGSVTSIGDYAFYGCSGLTSVTIPNSVTSIGYCAFYGCSGLTSVTIPNSVTSIGFAAFYGCSGLTSVTIGNSVTSIGDLAFYNCSSLTSITIPESVTNIGEGAFSRTAWFENQSDGLVYAGKFAYKYKGTMPAGTQIIIENGTLGIAGSAFYGCSGLTSVTIPNSVTSIGFAAFDGCSGLTSVTIGNSVTSIGYYAFCECTSLTSITIPNSMTSIGNSAFYSCSSLTSVTIGNSVTTIGNQAFYYCTSLTSVTIPESVTSIGNSAFEDCSALTSVTIGSGVTSIGDRAFYGCNNVKLYVNRGTDALLSVWKYGKDPYETGTLELLPRPTVSMTTSTQTTITYCINNFYPELEYSSNYDEVVGDNEYMIKGLRPQYTQTISLTVNSANNSYSTSTNITTSPISPTVISKDVTASSISVVGSYTEGDARVVSTMLTMDGRDMTGVEGYLHGLNPNTSYNCKYKVVVEYGEGYTYSYEGSSNIRTASLILTTQQPKVITVGNVVVAANSNLDDKETNVGFEWRRTDWTDDFASNTGVAYLYNGTMEGYIRNMYTEKLWKYRPYYESNSGNRYYGDWVGIDPTNTSYFEPTVHTYAQINVQGNRAEVKGYAMRGTDNIVTQGFVYWEAKRAASIPSDATKVTTEKGNIMTATLEDLEYETEYRYVAFAKTSEGETFYGEQQMFTTGEIDPDGIREIKDESLTPALSEGDWYDLSGRKIVNGKLPKGINIIRYSDGTSKKVLIK